jgi:hypothetical protein
MNIVPEWHFNANIDAYFTLFCSDFHFFKIAIYVTVKPLLSCPIFAYLNIKVTAGNEVAADITEIVLLHVKLHFRLFKYIYSAILPFL